MYGGAIDRLCPAAALACVVSFGWGMVWHFKRPARPHRGLIAFLVCALSSSGAFLYAFLTRPLIRPATSLACFVAALALYWWSISATRQAGLGACFQRETPSALVLTGPYRWLAHPFYLSYWLAFSGASLATSWWPAILLFCLMTALYWRAASLETRELLNGRHGVAYRAWHRRLLF